ncbi:hypothetical protein CCUG62472_03973 [Mycobacteroides salmoniphilum]|nr:hypothetical protein CCUG62472_03973 [Mycobacteroides salmoniphilum]
MATIGNMAPVKNDRADDKAACHGLVSSCGFSPNSASACAAKAS